MDGAGEDGGHDLQVGEDSLGRAAQAVTATMDAFGGTEEAGLTSSAGVESSTWVDCATSAAWMLLWYATSAR